MPYISASIILQLLTVVIPHLSKLAKEGERGRKTIIKYTRLGTIGIALIQGFGIGWTRANEQRRVCDESRMGFPVHDRDHPLCGTGFLMWLGEQITERGIWKWDFLSLSLRGLLRACPHCSSTDL